MRVILTLALALGSATAFTTPRSHLPLTRSTVVGSPFVKVRTSKSNHFGPHHPRWISLIVGSCISFGFTWFWTLPASLELLPDLPKSRRGTGAAVTCAHYDDGSSGRRTRGLLGRNDRGPSGDIRPLGAHGVSLQTAPKAHNVHHENKLTLHVNPIDNADTPSCL